MGDTYELELTPVRLRGPVPFVGRAAQLSRLHRLLAEPPCLVVLQGEAGIGKSRLVRQLLGELPGPVLFGEYDDVAQPARLGPVLNALSCETDHESRTREKLFADLAARLADLAPVTLVLEDLHWADTDSADFLAYLAAHPVDGVGVLITTRDPRAGARAPIHEALARTPSGALARIGLPPLDDAAVRELTGLTLRLPDPPAQLVATLRERTAGIPFVLEEVLRALSERGGDPLGDITVPYLLRDVVLYRMRALGATAGEVLGAAAVAGNEPRAGLLGQLLGLDEETVTAALAEAARAGLLHDGGDGAFAAGLVFRHDLARQAVYDLVPAPTRQSLHRRIARVLETSVPRPVAVLAQHYRLAGDNPAFVRNAGAAADLATARGDDATAARFLLQTMDVAELPRPTRVRLAAKLARSAIDGLSQVSAVPVLERLLADPHLPPGARGDLGLELGRMLRQQGEELRGYTEIERAVPYLRAPARRARALAVLAAPDTVPGRHADDHRERLAQAQDAAARCTDAGAALAVRIARVSLLIELGDPDAWPEADDLRGSPLLTARPREHARACLNWAHGALHTGDSQRAAVLAAEGRTLVGKTGYERLLPLGELTDLAVLRVTGRLRGVRERLAALRRECWRFPMLGLQVDLELALLQAVTDPAGARAGLLAVAEGARRVGAVLPGIRAHSGLGRVLLRDDPGAAAQHARQALELVRGKGIRSWGGEAALVLAEVRDAVDE
ncbi:AAA family ATPase [Kineosporia sp. J2-2]|uniref:AAA family ATPase n=1 Tax=Kineosporia corallincola TaxID=2835133 RepID=A0ABS5TP46_9ACTN|nr:AAA family ATPase [Kineosporia corallincola]MBT0772866.1 AAA family ATPase [Kineosporia corallincola]